MSDASNGGSNPASAEILAAMEGRLMARMNDIHEQTLDRFRRIDITLCGIGTTLAANTELMRSSIVLMSKCEDRT